MADDIHAIILIVTLIATAVILVKYASPQKTWENLRFVIKRSFIIFIIFIISAPVLLGHPSPRGVASSQSWIIFLCIFPMTILVHIKKIMYISVGILFCVNILLSMHYDLLVKSHNFIGRKNYSTLLEKRIRTKLENAREELSIEGESDKNHYPEGWLIDVINKPLQQRLRPYLDSTSSKQHELWHSSLTGLYALEEWKISLWYPGGMLETSGPKFVYKIKDKKPNNGVEQTPSK